MEHTFDIQAVYSEEIINGRLSIIRTENGRHKNTFAEDVKYGLTSPEKFLLPKYFYDATGSALFELICETDEYYVTNTEAEILKKHSAELAALNYDKKFIVELGSGSSVKTKYILSSFIQNSGNVAYLPIDVSDILIQGSNALLGEFEGLTIKGIIGEYEEGLAAAENLADAPKIILFLGSSLGNFNPGEAENLMRHISGSMDENDSALIGFDLVKDPEVLNRAYDDDAGITAKFNLNLLYRINEELGGNFDLDKFEHKAFYNEELSRVEMHLVSAEKQKVYIEAIDTSVHFEKGESIHTENSYKFTVEMINSLAGAAGLKVSQICKDEMNYFGLCLMTK